MAMRWSVIKDIAGAVGFIAVCWIFLREMRDLPVQAAKYPSTLIYLIFALCAVLLAKAVAQLASGANSRPPPAVAPEDQEKFGRPTLLVLVLSFLYVFSMPYIGFTLSSAAMMIAFMLAAGVRSLPVLILTPLGEIAFLRYVFEELLTVFLPDADFLRSILGMS
jgi:hypothetical protein